MVDRLAQIGFNVSEKFDLIQADSVVQGALSEARDLVNDSFPHNRERAGRCRSGGAAISVASPRRARKYPGLPAQPSTSCLLDRERWK